MQKGDKVMIKNGNMGGKIFDEGMATLVKQVIPNAEGSLPVMELWKVEFDEEPGAQ